MDWPETRTKVFRLGMTHFLGFGPRKFFKAFWAHHEPNGLTRIISSSLNHPILL